MVNLMVNLMVPDGNVFTLFFALSFFSILDIKAKIPDSKKGKKQRTPAASFFFLALSAFLYIY